MSQVLISVAADAGLRSTLDGVSRALALDAAIHIERYVSPGDGIDYAGDAATFPVVFIDLDEGGEAALATAQALRATPGANFQIVMATRAMDMELVRKILLDGEYTLLPLPATSAEITALLQRLDQKRRAARPRAGGKVVLFAGVNGGAGVTTLATHTAVKLAEEGRSAVLVDGRRKLGHAGLYLGLTESRGSIWNLASNEERLDDSLVASFIVAHPSGLHVLCSASKLEEDFSFTAESVEAVLRFLKARYEFVIIDAAANEETTPTLVSIADQVLFVATAEIAPLRDLARWSDFYGRDSEKFHVVVSHSGRGPITARHIEQTSGLPVAACLPEMNGSISSAVNAGRLVDFKVKDFYSALDQILNLAAPRPVQEEAAATEGGWFKRFRK